MDVYFRLVVALRHQIHVFSFPNPTNRLLTLETRDNIRGLCELSPMATSERHLLAFPGHKLGSVQLVVSKFLPEHCNQFISVKFFVCHLFEFWHFCEVNLKL